MTYLNQVFLFVITTKAFNLAELNFFNLWYVSLLKQKIQALFFFFFKFPDFSLFVEVPIEQNWVHCKK